MITQARLKEVLKYDSQTGIFIWLQTRNPRAVKGDRAGCLSKGYYRIRVDGKYYPAHRLAWLYVTGKMPVDEIDHINRIGADNRFDNLREADRTIQMRNLSDRDSISGYRGVYPVRGKFAARLGNGIRCIHLGYFEDPELANLIFEESKARYQASLHFMTPGGPQRLDNGC